MRCRLSGNPQANNFVGRATVVFLLLSVASPADQVQDAGQPGGSPGQEDAFAIDRRVAVVLTPRRQAVLSSEVPGRVVAINKELGHSFELGEPLVQLDDLSYRVNNRMAEARLRCSEHDLEQVQKLTSDRTRLRHAQAVFEAAEAKLLATQSLYNDGHASHVDLENARRDATTARTDRELVAAVSAKELIKAQRELAVSRGQLEMATYELEACVIRAPYVGRVARVLVNEHEFVERGRPLVEVVDDSVVLAKFLLPSALFRSVHIGQEVQLRVTEASRTVVGKVSHIAAVLDAASVTFEVHAEVDNTDGDLRAGMNGSLSLSSIGGR